MAAFPNIYTGHDSSVRFGAALMATPYIDYYEHSRDLQFLKDSAYPFIRNVAEFYASFAVKNADWKGEDGGDERGNRYDLLNTCAQEQCTQRQGGNKQYVNANTLVDIAHATMSFQKALEWSRKLEVDMDLRPRWSAVLIGLAPLPQTLDNGTLAFGPVTPLPPPPPPPPPPPSPPLIHFNIFLIN